MKIEKDTLENMKYEVKVEATSLKPACPCCGVVDCIDDACMGGIVRLEFSRAEVCEPDWALARYPFGVLTKMILRANELGLEGKEIEVVEVKENFGTREKYIDFVIKKQ